MSEEATPKKKNKLPLIIGGVVALLAAVGGGLYATGMVGGGGHGEGGEEEAAAEGEGEGEGEKAAEGEHGEKKAEHGEKKAEGEHGEKKAESEEKGGHVAAEGAEAVGKGMDGDGSQITNLGAFTVNLRGSGGGRVLRMEVQLDSEEEVAALLSARAPQLRDSIITAVSDYTWAELEGVDGKTRLRDELLTRLNGITSPNIIDRLYFTQFVVQ